MDTLSTDDSTFTINSESGYAKALLRALDFANVKFIRYLGVDIFNSVRCKAVPVDRLKKGAKPSLDYQVAFVKVCFGGLPTFGDALQPSSGMDASGTLILRPDLSSVRILPYSTTSAVTLGYLFDQETGRPSDLCCRGLLRRLVETAAEKHNVAFNVGAELEFCLVNAKTNKPVDLTNFADTVLLNLKESFISDLYDQLVKQDIEVELVHAESANGQFEIVLAYQSDPVAMADNVVLARETVRHLAHNHGLKALFLPKHNPMQAGSGCHVHLSVRDKTSGKNLFVDPQDSATSIGKVGQSFMEGILQHLPALLAVSLPTVNSYRRMAEGCWTGHQASWAFDDKEAPLRVVSNHEKQSWEHVEFKLCDSYANLHLALACILWCGLDSIVRDLPLRPPRDETKEPESLPTSLTDSLEKLENDDLLIKLIPKSMMKAYLAVRRVEEERSSKMSLADEVQEALDRA